MMVCLDDTELIAKTAIAKAMLSVRLAKQGRAMGDFHVSVCDGWLNAYANYWCSDHTEYLGFQLGELVH
jgi:hypothetical protein